MAVAKYSGNMRQTGIGIKELKQMVKVGDRFDYTYESFSAKDFTPKKKTTGWKLLNYTPIWSSLK